MRRLATATLAGLTVFGLVNGLAASMTVTGSDLGSGQAVTAACDQDGITVAFGVTPGAASEVSELDFSGVATACDTQSVYIDVLAEDGSVLTSETGTVALGGGSTFTITLTTPQAADLVFGAAVTITG